MSKHIGSTLAILISCPLSSVLAGTGEVEASAVGVAVHLLLLIGGILCFFICAKIYLLLKGGELSTGWQLFAASFLFFSIAELLNLSAALEIVALQPNIVRVVQVLALFLILFGVTKIKKSLS